MQPPPHASADIGTTDIGTRLWRPGARGGRLRCSKDCPSVGQGWPHTGHPRGGSHTLLNTRKTHLGVCESVCRAYAERGRPALPTRVLCDCWLDGPGWDMPACMLGHARASLRRKLHGLTWERGKGCVRVWKRGRAQVWPLKGHELCATYVGPVYTLTDILETLPEPMACISGENGPLCPPVHAQCGDGVDFPAWDPPACSRWGTPRAAPTLGGAVVGSVTRRGCCGCIGARRGCRWVSGQCCYAAAVRFSSLPTVGVAARRRFEQLRSFRSRMQCTA